MTAVVSRETLVTMSFSTEESETWERMQEAYRLGKQRGRFTTQRDLAKKAGWKSMTQWSRWAKGFEAKPLTFKPSVPHLEGLARVCGVNAWWIRTGQGPRDRSHMGQLTKNQRAAMNDTEWVGVDVETYDWVKDKLLEMSDNERVTSFWKGQIQTLIQSRKTI